MILENIEHLKYINKLLTNEIFIYSNIYIYLGILNTHIIL